MNGSMREYVLKGIFVGLWAYLALAQPSWSQFGQVAAITAAGFLVGLVVGSLALIRRGYQPMQNLPGFLMLTLLDNPLAIYSGIIGGLGLGVVFVLDPAATASASSPSNWLGYAVAVGAVLGFGFYQLSMVRESIWRGLLGLIIGGSLIYLSIHYLNQLDEFATQATKTDFAVQLLLGLPFFYLLVFCGRTEETEVEIAAICALLGIGLFLARLSSGLPEYADKLIFIVPLSLYFVYATQVLPYLRVFKHTLRGYGHMAVGKTQPALASFGRALELESLLPVKRRGQLATRGMLQLHREVDLAGLDETTTKLLNFEFCLAVVESVLLGDRAPTEAQREDAQRMLNLVEVNQVDLRPKVDYLRAVLHTHGKQFDEAAASLRKLLDPDYEVKNKLRAEVLIQAWDLALRLHPEMTKRLGPNELAKPRRRMEAIYVAERRVHFEPADESTALFLGELYAGLTEEEYRAFVGQTPKPLNWFNYDRAEQLGLALIDDADAERQQRGIGFLKIVAHGGGAKTMTAFLKLADTAAKTGQPDQEYEYLLEAKDAGRKAFAELDEAQKKSLLALLERLVNLAEKREDFDTAVACQRQLIEVGKEDIDTLRRLAGLHEKAGDVLNALLITERGLLYSKKDADLKQKKEAYYYSVDPERVRAVKEKVATWFDTPYLIDTAQKVANQKEPDLETLDWGLHLVQLARIILPENQAAMLAEARLRLRKGERDEGLRLLEDLREMKCGSGDEEDAWYSAIRILGEIYLEELDRPDLAADCFKTYRDYQKSGGETLYLLGRSLEATGDARGAINAYEGVTVYTNHPRYWDAKEAIRRLKAESAESI